MKAFNESMRYEYPLDENSVIIDGGGYEGNWFRQMFQKYKCHCHVYEPVHDFFTRCSQVATELEDGPERKIHVHKRGLWIMDTFDEFHIKGDSTGSFAVSDKPELVKLNDVADVVKKIGLVDVLKLNIEGHEYDVIEHLKMMNLLGQIKNIQVQCHFNHPEAKTKYNYMKWRLSETHEPEWDSEPVWQNWRLK